MVSVYNPDCICIVESWLSPDIDDSEVHIPNFQVCRLDRNRHGGGVLLYVKDEFHFSQLPGLSCNLEIVSVVLQHHSFPIRFCLSLVYRPPNTNSSALDLLSSYLQAIDISQFANVVVLGDFNIDVSTNTHPLAFKLHSIMSTLSLVQMVNNYTHVHHNSTATTIDLLFVSNPQLVHDCSTIPPLANADHFGLLVSLSLQTSYTPKKSRTVWRYEYANWSAACDLLGAIDWASVLDPEDVEKSWAIWRDIFLGVMDQCIPKAILPARRNRPWLTKRLIQSIRRRNALFRQAKLTKDFTQYRTYRNKVVNYLRCAKRAYFLKLNPRHPKQFWKACKNLMRSTTCVPTLVTENATVHSNMDKAKVLNSFLHHFLISHIHHSLPIIFLKVCLV